MSTGTARVIIQRQNGEVLADHNLAHGTYGIGRDPGNALYCDSEYLSRQHATLTLAPDQCWIEDNQSTHGTFLNGARLTEPTAAPVIKPCRLAICISLSPAHQPPTMPPVSMCRAT